MEKEKRLEDMSIDELATLLVDHPERANDIWRVMLLEEKDMDELYKAVGSLMLPDGTIVDDYGIDFNDSVEEALEEIASWSGYDSRFAYEIDEDERENRKRHQAQIREIQETLSNNIAYGDTPKLLRQYCEFKGYTLEDWYDTETLKEAYKKAGYQYDPESDTITEIDVLMEAEEEYSAYLDSLEIYKMGDNPEIDNKINECLNQGYLPSYIDTILEDYGYTLSPEDLKEMYYKCGFEYDIETGSARKIVELGENVREEDQVEYDEKEIFDSTDKKQVEFFLKKYLAQKESMEVELKEIKSKMAEMEREMHSIGGSEFDPEFHELFDLHDRMEELEDAIAKSTERVDFYQSVMELHRKEEELSKLEAEEKTISDAEALIDKQTGKEGQDIGEE